jgi:hypothetical protein
MRVLRAAALLAAAWCLGSVPAHTRPPREEDLVPSVATRKLTPRVEPKPPAPSALRRLPSPADAVAEAHADALTLPHPECYRYLWCPEGVLDQKCAALVCNVVSRATAVYRPVPVGRLLRVDLRRLSRSERDLGELKGLWEDFCFDPSFSVLVTPDQLRFAHAAGATVEIDSHKAGSVVRVDGLHLDRTLLGDLQHRLHTGAPVTEWRYFAWRSLTAIKDRGVYADVWGGRYYELRGIRKGKVKGATDLDVLLDQFGVGNVSAGLTADKLFDRLRSDQRAGLFRSGVTGKPRRVDWFHGPDARDGTGAISVTHDLRDQDVDVGTHPVFNLLHFKEAATEVILEGTNGMHVYTIHGANQELLDEAAQEVVSDRTVPNPFPPRLQPALSCIACHEEDGSDGWKPTPNDVRTMLARRTRLDVFGDLSKQDQLDAVDRVGGLYAGDFTKAIRRARDDYAEAVLKAAGPWPESKDQTDVVKHGMGRLARRVREYWYGAVSPRDALRELGIDAPADRAKEVFAALLPPDKALDAGGYYQESPTLGALKEGLSVNRSDWDLVKGFAAVRAVDTLAALRGKR